MNFLEVERSEKKKERTDIGRKRTVKGYREKKVFT